MKSRRHTTRRRRVARVRIGPAERAAMTEAVVEHAEHWGTSARLTGGDVDADWARADAAGDEAVGGSVTTPDQDVVDEIGEALGVPQEPDAEFRPSVEILAERDRNRWRLEPEDERRPRRRT